jgi:hypothetical protein
MKKKNEFVRSTDYEVVPTYHLLSHNKLKALFYCIMTNCAQVEVEREVDIN